MLISDEDEIGKKTVIRVEVLYLMVEAAIYFFYHSFQAIKSSDTIVLMMSF